MRDYTPKIDKKDLVDGAYYKGQCRNASIARWDGSKERFVHWRTKFGHTFLEEICHPEDDQIYDVFVVEHMIETPEKEIPIYDENHYRRR